MYNTEHSFKLFQEALTNDKLPSVVLLCGSEGFLVDWARNGIVSKYIEEASKVMDYTVLDEQELNSPSLATSILEICETPPILSKKRVVIVRNPKLMSSSEKGDSKTSELGRLCSYLKDLPDYTLLVFTADTVDKRLKLPKAISQNGTVFDFGPLEKGDFISFASKRFRDAGIHVSKGVMDYLIDETGYFNKESDYNLYTFSNDIVKMIALTEGKELTEEVVKEATEGDDETFIFTLLDSVVEGNKGKALRMLRNMVGTSSDAIRIAARLVDHFEIMYSIKEYQKAKAPDRMIVDRMGIKDARLRIMKRFTDRFTAEKLREILHSAYEIERNIKTGLLGYMAALEYFVSKL